MRQTLCFSFVYNKDERIMAENTTQLTRPTKKQHQTLEFIRGFIAEHGYSPSYREIMRGCNYTSVATVALHVNSLIKRGHIVKRDKSARSLEVVGSSKNSQESGANPSKNVSDSVHELVANIESRFVSLEAEIVQEILDEVYVLTGALKVLGHHELAREYAQKINDFNNSAQATPSED